MKSYTFTQNRPCAQEVRLFRSWASAGTSVYIPPPVEETIAREEEPTMYGGPTVDQGDAPRARMAMHAHRSVRARENAGRGKQKGAHEVQREGKKAQLEGREGEKTHKGDRYTTEPYQFYDATPLPPLMAREERMIEQLYRNPKDAGETREVREHVVARLFASWRVW